MTRRHACCFVIGLGLSLCLACSVNQIFARERVTKPEPRDVTKSLAQRIEQERIGHELFTRDWSQPDVKPAEGGDGLGPMFNDVSCVACHQLGGIGGAGAAEKNVQLLHLTGAHGSPLKSTLRVTDRINKARQKVHPELGNGTTSVVLHRQERTDGVTADDYQRWLARRLPQTMLHRNLPQRRLVPAEFGFLEPMPGTFRAEGLPVRLTERNTTALFGAGLIDSIPDAVIVELANRQKKQHAPLISTHSTVCRWKAGRHGRSRCSPARRWR